MTIFIKCIRHMTLFLNEFLPKSTGIFQTSSAHIAGRYRNSFLPYPFDRGIF